MGGDVSVMVFTVLFVEVCPDADACVKNSPYVEVAGVLHVAYEFQFVSPEFIVQVKSADAFEAGRCVADVAADEDVYTDGFAPPVVSGGIPSGEVGREFAAKGVVEVHAGVQGVYGEVLAVADVYGVTGEFKCCGFQVGDSGDDAKECFKLCFFMYDVVAGAE